MSINEFIINFLKLYQDILNQKEEAVKDFTPEQDEFLHHIKEIME